jgi:hypothetical protein
MEFSSMLALMVPGGDRFKMELEWNGTTKLIHNKLIEAKQMKKILRTYGIVIEELKSAVGEQISCDLR